MQEIEIFIKALKKIPNSNNYNETINLIINTINNNGKIIFSGVGKAKDIAKTISSQFNSISIKSIFIDATDAGHGDIGILSKKDILFLISNSGKTNELIELIHLAKLINKNIKIITITSNKNSPIAKLSNIILLTGCKTEISNDKTSPASLVPTVSLILMIAISNILVFKLINKTNFKLEQYRYNHNKGYINSLIEKGLLKKIN